MSSLARRIAVMAVSALLAGPWAHAFAAAKLFKCVDGGRTVYQQQACSPSAQPETAASAPAATAKATAPVGDPASTGRKIRAPSSPASSALATPR